MKGTGRLSSAGLVYNLLPTVPVLPLLDWSFKCMLYMDRRRLCQADQRR